MELKHERTRVRRFIECHLRSAMDAHDRTLDAALKSLAKIERAGSQAELQRVFDRVQRQNQRLSRLWSELEGI